MATGVSVSSNLVGLSVEELADRLLLKGISQDAVNKLKEHAVNGETLMALTDDHLKEVTQRLADRINLRKIISAEQEVYDYIKHRLASYSYII